jgi:outer membrane protein OmpA-like peptidoglycan-associated protein
MGRIVCALLAALALPGVAAAQETSRPPLELVFPSVDLVRRSLDLEVRTEALKGATQALSVKETDTEVRIELSGDVLFDFDKADLRADAEPTLTKVADVIKAHPQASVSIEGHTDAKGAAAYNQQLSERRAASVKEWLVRNGGVDGAKVRTAGLGATKPVAPNARPDGSDDPEGRQRNRRVEITVKK